MGFSARPSSSRSHNHNQTRKLPRPEGRGIPPMMGFQPQTCGRPRRVARTAFSPSEPFRSLGRTLGGGFVRRGAGLWRGTFAPRWGDRLAHTALIPGGLERGRFTRRLLRLGGTAASAPSFGTSPGCSIRGTPTGAPTLGHVRPKSSITRHGLMHDNTTGPVGKPPGRPTAVAQQTNALLHALKGVVSALWFL